MNSLREFLNQGVSPYHASDALVQILVQAGAQRLDEAEAWHLEPGGFYLVRRGGTALAAFRLPPTGKVGAFSLALAHLDSPALKLKSQAVRRESAQVVSLGTETYGSPLLHTWFDRDLGLAGQVILEKEGQLEYRNVLTPPLAVVPNLAIHYNREANKGTPVDAQKHLNALVCPPGKDAPEEGLLNSLLGLEGRRILGSDLFFYDPQPAGFSKDSPTGLFTSGRIDNLAGCHAVVQALTGAEHSPGVQMGLFFDQEEVGSRTRTGADSPWLNEIMERIVHCFAPQPGREALFQAQARSLVLSIDAAHGVHPNFADRHDESYAPRLGQGPVLKSSARYSYSTTGETEALVRLLADKQGLPLQHFIMRSDLAPGSTVGPTSSSWTGIPCADLGIPMLAMHSIRETAHLGDQASMVKLVKAFFERD